VSAILIAILGVLTAGLPALVGHFALGPSRDLKVLQETAATREALQNNSEADDYLAVAQTELARQFHDRAKNAMELRFLMTFMAPVTILMGCWLGGSIYLAIKYPGLAITALVAVSAAGLCSALYVSLAMLGAVAIRRPATFLPRGPGKSKDETPQDRIA